MKGKSRKNVLDIARVEAVKAIPKDLLKCVPEREGFKSSLA